MGISMIRRLVPRTRVGPSTPAQSQRSRRFEHDQNARYWWHQIPDAGYVPPVYRTLTDDEWRVLEDWFDETTRLKLFGEIGVPAMSVVHSLITGNALTRIVQLGHYCGYSALLIGFMLRAMAGGGKLFSIDIDPEATRFAQLWLERASLLGHVSLHVGDSCERSSVDAALRDLQGVPQLTIVDSSHQHDHTLKELDAWVPRMGPGSILVLHDTSVFARSFDHAGAGGVQQALDEWLPGHPEVAHVNLNRAVAAFGESNLAYKDPCGLGILQVGFA
jgi:predicted O-methyltransferase YrrM